MNFAAGQLPQQPGVDRTEGEIALLDAKVTSSLSRPASLNEPGDGEDGSSHSMLGMRRQEGSMTLEAEQIPDDVLTFKAGTLIDSTLKSSDEIERV